MFILNLTQHLGTPEQVACGVYTLPAHLREWLSKKLTFTASELLAPDAHEVLRMVAEELAEFAYDCLRQEAHFEGVSDEQNGGDFNHTFTTFMAHSKVLVGGLPILMEYLVPALKEAGLKPVYAVSDRVSVDEVQPDGSVKVSKVFRHVGFIPSR